MKTKFPAILIFTAFLLSVVPGMGQGSKAEKTPSLDELPDFEAHRFVPADEDQTEDDNFILRRVNEGLKETLRLGWVLPPDRLVLDKKIEEVTAYAGGSEVWAGKLIGPMTETDLAQTRGQFQMVCEPYSNYFVYHLTGPAIVKAERAVVAVTAFPNAQIGSRSVTLLPEYLDKALEALEGKGKYIHRYLASRTLDGNFVYSFHCFFDPASKQLVKSGMVLQGTLPKVMAKSLEKFDPAQNCKDCGMPQAGDPLEKVFDPIDLIQTSLFPDPLVLLKNENAEARSLSLVTFDPQGHKSEVWANESLTDCGNK